MKTSPKQKSKHIHHPPKKFFMTLKFLTLSGVFFRKVFPLVSIFLRWWQDGIMEGQTWRQSELGSSPDSSIYWLCDLKQVL